MGSTEVVLQKMQLKLKGVVSGYNLAMVTRYIKCMTTTDLPMTEHLCDTIISASSYEEGMC